MAVNFTNAQINGYVLHAEIGRGGMGRVYRATHSDTSHQFAIKVVNGTTTGDLNFEKRFSSVIAVVKQLDHPNILPILASGQEDDGTLFMVTPLVEGGTLRDFQLSNTALTLVQVRALATQIGEALDYAHGQGILHRDVKPHNIMMLADGRWSLTDFGIAALLSIPETLTNLTSTGATPGTFVYMSPERIGGGDVDSRADLYSLGVVMYQALVGRLPFVGENAAMLLSQQLNAQPVAPHLINPDFPISVEAVLGRSLARNAADRYQTGAEFAQAFCDAFDVLAPAMLNLPLVTREQIAGAGAWSAKYIPLEPQQEKQPDRRPLTLAALRVLVFAITACRAFIAPLHDKLADAPGTSAALGSLTPTVVTQVATNAVGGK